MAEQSKKIVLGTRGSELARAQAQMVSDKLLVCWPELEIETRIIKTSGDESKTTVVDLRAGRKGLFTGEIERALLGRDIDLGVHSAKDLPSSLGAETEISAVLPRAPVDDILVMTTSPSLKALPQKSIVGTGSVRRKHQLRWQRPDLEIADLRGNVPSRLRKLAHEQWGAVVLARAGLERIGLTPSEGTIRFEKKQFQAELLPREIFLPAGGQGVIAIQTRTDNDRLRTLLEPVNDRETGLCLWAEREFLRLLQADCNQPIGVLATIAGSTMGIRAQIFEDRTKEPRTARVEGHSGDPENLAAELFERINR